MNEALIEEIDRLFPNKALLTVSEVCTFLACDKKVVYNWIKRPDAQRRPPRLSVGKEIRFPKKDFVSWLSKEQGHVV